MDQIFSKELSMTLEGTLGRGSFATVYKGSDRLGNSYAIKVFDKSTLSKSKLMTFRKEAQILASLSHQNIVTFVNVKESEGWLFLVMEYIQAETLKSFMEKNLIQERQAAGIVKQILLAIQYLHRLNIIHRDLKPQNILILKKGNYSSNVPKVKIIDFGLSAQMEQTDRSNIRSQCGTLLFMAPEMVHQPSYSKSIDIWSVAVITYMLISKKHPIYTIQMGVEQYKEKLKTVQMKKIETASFLANNFIENSGKIDYMERYSVNECLLHPWVTGNQQEEIPLSVKEVARGFATCQTLAHTIRFLIVGHQWLQGQCEINQNYRNKVISFGQMHQSLRVASPEHKKNKRKNQISSKLKQLLVIRQPNKTEQHKKQEMKLEDYLELDSPLVRKHQKVFTSLFEKPRISTIALSECQTVHQISMSHDICSSQSKQGHLNENEKKKSQLKANLCSIRLPQKATDILSGELELPIIRARVEKKRGLRKLSSLGANNAYNQITSNMSFGIPYGDAIISEDILDHIKESEKDKKLKGRKVLLHKNISFGHQNKGSPKNHHRTLERRKTVSTDKRSKPMIFSLRSNK